MTTIHIPRTTMQRAAAGVALALAGATAVCTPANGNEADSPVASAITQAEASINTILAVPNTERNFDNTILAIDDMLAHLEFETSMTQFMPYVSTDPEERAAGQAATQELQAWLIDFSQRQDVFDAVKSVASRVRLQDPVKQRLVDHMMRDYRRSGMDLTPEDRAELADAQKQLSALAIEFDTTIREDDTAVLVARDELSGMPTEYIDGLKRVGELYLITMDYPTFLPLQDYCDNEQTRKKVWMMYKRRGGEKNVNTLGQILKLRARQANLLGYANPADYEIEVRMAKNSGNVLEFYERLRPLVRKKAKLDHAELVNAKRAHTGNRDARLYPWDTNFYTKVLMKEKYAVDAEKVREYFPIESVIDGLFSITQSLYGLEYKEMTDRAVSMGRPMWHEDVRLFEVWDKNSGDHLGDFYIDLHPRPNKYGHAAQWGLRQHKRWADGTYAKPLAALVCNFSKPTANKPSLMTHDEVETFFHEFGHCLHTIVSESDYYHFAGTSVERDFVEAPSQMFENWVWNKDVLRTFAKHYQTGEVLPDALLDGMLKAKNLGSGMAAERQFYYGMFDLTCHLDADGDIDTNALAQRLWDPAHENIELYAPVHGTFFHAAFGHLTGYQAGYYGYQWSLVYACDMFQRFKELGMLDPAAGMYYRKKILGRGGDVDGLDMVRDYLGREPDLSAYLKHLGLE